MQSSWLLRSCSVAAVVALLGVAGVSARAQELSPKPVQPRTSFLSPLRRGASRGSAARPLLLDPKARPTTRSTARRLDRPRLSDSFLPDLTQQWDGEPLPTLTSTPELRLEQRGLQSTSSSSAAAAAARRKRQLRTKTIRILNRRHQGGVGAPRGEP
jgi:hypothetical protein